MISEKKNDDKTLATIKALQQMKQVLESGSGIKGFNRKVQLKPLKFDTPISSPHVVHNSEPLPQPRRISSSLSDRTEYFYILYFLYYF